MHTVILSFNLLDPASPHILLVNLIFIFFQVIIAHYYLFHYYFVFIFDIINPFLQAGVVISTYTDGGCRALE